MRTTPFQDHAGVDHVPLDHDDLAGAWCNTDRRAGGVRRLVLTDRSGALVLRAYGAGRPEPYDWGEAPVRAYADTPTSRRAWAFTASYDAGFRTMHVSAYTRGGLLVLTTYNAFSGAGWPQPYWTREFFHRQPAPPAAEPPYRPRAAPGQADGATAPLLPWQLDPGPLVGTWRNIDPAARRLARVRITERDGYLVLRPHGVWGPRRHDWHATVGSAFAEDVRTNLAAAFTAFFLLSVGQVEMVGYLDRRLLTIETASTFTDGGGRSPHFVREHFYPLEEG